MELLLEYMYQGRIAVKHHELADVLKTASGLKIRGLTTSDNDNEVPPLVMDTDNNDNEAVIDKFHHIETASNVSAASGVSGTSKKTESGGRKSSKPKKLRLSGDTDSEISPRYPVSLQEKTRVSPIDEAEDGIVEETDEEKELVIDQPVDFSSKTEKPDSKYSILGSYLKANKLNNDKFSKSTSDLSDNIRRGLGSGWMNSLSSLSAPRPASRDSRGYSKEDDEEALADDKNDNKDYPQLSLSESMGMGDIAERLRTHFLANMPSQSYNWLTSGHNALLDKVKREKHPSGGIK